MDGRTQGAMLLAVGGVAVRLGVSGAALTFIRPAYVPLLIIAGAILVVLGGVTLVAALRRPEAAADAEDPHAADDHAHGHGHDHARGPRIAWLLAAPLFAILLIAPPPLGSYAAARQSGVVRTTVSSFPELPAAEDGAVALSLGDYAARALYDTERSLEGRAVRLVGFASGGAAEGWVLTRFALSCCAADGTAVDVEVREGGPAPALDQWVEVTGTWQPRAGHEIGELTDEPPILVADSVTLVAQPEQPYES